jgi:hypothetical protein
MKDFDGIRFHAIRHYLRQPLKHQFAGAFLKALAPPIGKLPERADGLVNPKHGGMRQVRLVLLRYS